MRDPNRLDQILERIKKVWKQFPDLRLGQLLLNVYRDPSLYYVEDEELMDAMEKLYNKKDGE